MFASNRKTVTQSCPLDVRRSYIGKGHLPYSTGLASVPSERTTGGTSLLKPVAQRSIVLTTMTATTEDSPTWMAS